MSLLDDGLVGQHSSGFIMLPFERDDWVQFVSQHPTDREVTGVMGLCNQGVSVRMNQGRELTPAEARVVDQLLQGREMQEVANGLGITLETARFHTKRVLSKTGTRRQTELMRLVLSLPSPDNSLPV